MKRLGRAMGFLALGACMLTLGTLLIGTLIGLIFLSGIDTTLDQELIEAAKGDKTTCLFYRDESGLLIELESERISGAENTLYCRLDEMSPHLINAFVAIEDKRFWDHGGIDWLRTVKAAACYLGHGASDFGGSTITQQLIKNLTGENDRSIERKACELIRAAEIERKYDKAQILELYLNVVNLAENCYGVRTAANLYYSKEPAQLTVAQAASIAAITNNPSRYMPTKYPQNNKARRDLILLEMYKQGKLSKEEYDKACAEPLGISVNPDAARRSVRSWYTDLVISDVIEELVLAKGLSRAKASAMVFGSGLKIEVCVDPEMQTLLEAYYQDEAHFPKNAQGKQMQSAMMILDPKTGDILALVGAVGQKNSNRIQNYATDTQRPSGSVIKPLSVYAPAIEADLITAATVFDDIPRSFRANGAPWPHNSPNLYRGLTTVQTAVAESVNTVSVTVLERLGIDASVRFLREGLAFRSLTEQDRSLVALALGQQAQGVSLRELVGGYTALANRGVFEGARSFARVWDRNGELLLEKKPTERRVLSRESAAIMTMLLRRVVKEGTAKSLKMKNGVDVAAKTGTSSHGCDKWFIGYTPEFLAGVWCGYEYPEPLPLEIGNPSLKIFDEIMGKICQADDKGLDTDADLVAVRYCKDSGALFTERCALDPRGDRSAVGYFKKGTEPTVECHCHVVVDYCADHGVAFEDCPTQTRKQVALLRVTRSFPRQIYVADAAYTYGGIPLKREPELTDNEPYYAQNKNSDRFFGIGLQETPFNRGCAGHEDAEFWKRRLTLPTACGS